MAGIAVAAPERGIHGEQAGLPESGACLVIVPLRIAPGEIIDAVAPAAYHPYDDGVLLAVSGVAGHIGGQVAHLGGVGDQVEEAFRRRGDSVVIVFLPDKRGSERVMGFGEIAAALYLGLGVGGQGIAVYDAGGSGVFSLGVFSLGVFSLGVLSLGVLSLGAFALGTVVSGGLGGATGHRGKNGGRGHEKRKGFSD